MGRRTPRFGNPISRSANRKKKPRVSLESLAVAGHSEVTAVKHPSEAGFQISPSGQAFRTRERWWAPIPILSARKPVALMKERFGVPLQGFVGRTDSRSHNPNGEHVGNADLVAGPVPNCAPHRGMGGPLRTAHPAPAYRLAPEPRYCAVSPIGLAGVGHCVAQLAGDLVEHRLK